jgi:hypothetical protein
MLAAVGRGFGSVFAEIFGNTAVEDFGSVED